MCDTQWDPLVEFLFRSSEQAQSPSSNVFCLCSRSFSRTKDDKEDRNRQVISAGEEFSASESDFREDEYPDETPNEEFHCKNSSDLKLDTDAEVVSCYCSASHTDNISTDEHDSIRESHSSRPHTHILRGLQSSDSGADLTEHVRNDPDAAWHKFWANHGERLIWDSWITKYSDYINPDYLTSCDPDNNDGADLADAKDDAPHNQRVAEHSKSKFSFDKKDIDKLEPNLSIIEENKVLTDKTRAHTHEIIQRNRQLIRNLSSSDSLDKLNADISEGWNPLSPLSIDCETEAERLLLGSRCGSYASGSLRTVDSMTNVTRMTVSSIDLSDSSKNSESFSSVSSVQSSLSSTSSEEFDDNAEYNCQWNTLWKNHYEDEHLRQYKKFMSIQTGGRFDSTDSEINSFLLFNAQVLQSYNKTLRERKSSNNSSFEEPTEVNHRKKKKNEGKKCVEAVSVLLGSIKMDEAPSTSTSKTEDDSVEYVEEVDKETLKSLGLPTSFTKKRTTKRQLSKSFSSVDSETSRSTQSLSDRVKSAFNLMGIELEEGIEPKLAGQVDYKMKHIRLQNRHLKLQPVLERQVHNYFDDAGNAVAARPDDLKSTTSSEDLVSPATVEVDALPSDKFSSPLATNPNLARFRGARANRKKRVLPPEIKENPKLRKYWDRRFSLFNKFDMGIKLDEESWYSVTPETVAKHIADRCKCDVIIDAFCGAGGNTIQFAKTCKKVIAIDIDPKKIELARHNAEVYGVLDRIEFIVGDFFVLAPELKGNIVFLSPPWGGPDYLHKKTYELEEMLQPVPLSKLLECARKISKNIALFLPKNSNTYPLVQEAGPGGFVELEQNFLNKKLIAVTAFYNDLIKRA